MRVGFVDNEKALYCMHIGLVNMQTVWK